MSDDSVQTNGDISPAVITPRQRRPSNIWLIIVASLFIIVPFLTWYFTWFGRSLSDEKIVEYLADEKKPRNIQHALTGPARFASEIEADAVVTSDGPVPLANVLAFDAPRTPRS